MRHSHWPHSAPPPGRVLRPLRRTAGWVLDPASAAGTPPAVSLALLRTCLASVSAPGGQDLSGWALPQLGSALWAAASLAGALRQEAEVEAGSEGGRGLAKEAAGAMAAVEAWLSGPEGSAAAAR